ncbi:MAG: hypothetical protein AB9M53_00250 [Leptothrix sp. (in: b-proteobacteria)]
MADCDQYRWPAAAYDGIAAIFIQFADPAMRERLFAAMVRSPKPGGTLLLHGHTPKQLDHRAGNLHRSAWGVFMWGNDARKGRSPALCALYRLHVTGPDKEKAPRALISLGA